MKQTDAVRSGANSDDDWHRLTTERNGEQVMAHRVGRELQEKFVARVLDMNCIRDAFLPFAASMFR
jgi:hypothetical protein